MKRKTRILLLVLAAVLLLGIAGAIYATTRDDPYFSLGRLFRSARNRQEANATGSAGVVATYNGHEITATVVAYQKGLNSMRTPAEAARYQTDRDVIDRIAETYMVQEEAERRGLTASEEEIEEMVRNAQRAYELPEGKALLDSYCQGAGITIDEYYDLLREQAPATIARQKLKDAVGKEYCEAHGLTFTKSSPPQAMLDAQDAFFDDLFRQHKGEIQYFIS